MLGLHVAGGLMSDFPYEHKENLLTSWHSFKIYNFFKKDVVIAYYLLELIFFICQAF